MTFKAKSANSTVTSLLTLGGQNVKYVNHFKYLGIILDTELSDDKDTTALGPAPLGAPRHGVWVDCSFLQG